MPHVCRRHHAREPKELDRGPGSVSSAEPDDGCRRSQENWRARLSLDHPGDQALPRGLRSAAENREIRPGAVRSDDGAVPALGSQSVVVDVRISGGLTHTTEPRRRTDTKDLLRKPRLALRGARRDRPATATSCPISSQYFGVDRYVRPIDSPTLFWPN